MTSSPTIQSALTLIPEQTTAQIYTRLWDHLKTLKRKGLIVAISGGIDSSVTLALAVKALGTDRVLALQMPERHSAEETLSLSGLLAQTFDVETIHEDISGPLEAVKFYQRYEKAVQIVIPEYSAEWKSKIVIANVIHKLGFTYFSIVAQSPSGETIKKRLPLKAYLEIVAATNFKQRIRKMLEYYHADRLNFAVTGTPNRLEYDQVFLSNWVMVQLISNPLHIFTKHKCTSLQSTSVFQKRFANDLQQRTPIHCPRLRMNFTSALPMIKWIYAFMGKTTGFQHQMLPPRLV